MQRVRIKIEGLRDPTTALRVAQMGADAIGLVFAESPRRVAPAEGPYYRHDDLAIRTEGLEDDLHEFPNGHSHIRSAMLSSSSQTIPIVDGKLLLGRYQKVFFCELDRGKARKVFMQVIGE